MSLVVYPVVWATQAKLIIPLQIQINNLTQTKSVQCALGKLDVISVRPLNIQIMMFVCGMLRLLYIDQPSDVSTIDLFVKIDYNDVRHVCGMLRLLYLDQPSDVFTLD